MSFRHIACWRASLIAFWRACVLLVGELYFRDLICTSNSLLFVRLCRHCYQTQHHSASIPQGNAKLNVDLVNSLQCSMLLLRCPRAHLGTSVPHVLSHGHVGVTVGRMRTSVCQFAGSVHEALCYGHVGVTVMSGEDYYDSFNSFVCYDFILL